MHLNNLTRDSFLNKYIATIYPSIIPHKQIELINNCDVYLDINYGRKEELVIDRIKAKNIPIFSFRASKSINLNYKNYHIFEDGEIDEMAHSIEDTVKKSSKTTEKRYDIRSIFDLMGEERIIRHIKFTTITNRSIGSYFSFI